jgi:branched-chain amino acid transport system substrate-binding protein
MQKTIIAALALLVSGAAQAAADEPIRIGVTTTMTGTAALFGQHEKMGVELALGELNAQGGVIGRKLEVVVEDNRCNPAEGVKAATKLISDHKVVAMLGAMCSSVTLAIMPVVQRAELPLLVEISTAAAIVQQSGIGGNDWVFKLNPGDDDMAEAIVAFLAKENVKRVAFAAEDTDYGRGGVKVFAEAMKKHGMEVSATEHFPQGLPDFSTLLTKMAALKPDRIAGYFLKTDNDNIFRQVEALDLRIPFTGRIELSLAAAAVSPQFLKAGGLDGTSGINPYAAAWPDPANQAFVAKFKQANAGQEPLQQSFYGYEATLLLADAIKRAGKAEPKAIRDALKTAKFKSMLGATLEFDEHNHAHNNALILQIKNGTLQFVGLAKT